MWGRCLRSCLLCSEQYRNKTDALPIKGNAAARLNDILKHPNTHLMPESSLLNCPNFLHILLSVWRKLSKFAFSWRKQLLLSEQNVPRNISRIVHILLWADESTDREILSTTTLKLYDSEICSIISCHTKSCTKIKIWIIYSISTWFVWFSINIFHNF